ncbi:MAG TPA: pyridoxamine 5'-phosphate oxidase family protein [Streptosporangiaceae bacterium]|nr:pyridoxamine 5'-phosphate oxidase family protein [Streptosporangiaceae bacterium]
MTVLGAARALLPSRPTRRRQFELRQPGSEGERILQQQLGTTARAEQFYQNKATDYLTPAMQQFIQRMEMAFIATSGLTGECDCSFRAGEAGFIRVIDECTIAYPELRGNGVMASLGNMLENPHIGIFMADFTRDLIGLHVNGDASIVPSVHMLEFNIAINENENAGRKPVQWVLIHVTEAFIHCSKHIPLLVPQSRVRHWGTDNPRHKGGDYFGVRASRNGDAYAAGNGHAHEQPARTSLSAVSAAAPGLPPQRTGQR